MAIPNEAKTVPLGQKPKRGRRPLAKPALQRQDAPIKSSKRKLPATKPPTKKQKELESGSTARNDSDSDRDSESDHLNEAKKRKLLIISKPRSPKRKTIESDSDDSEDIPLSALVSRRLTRKI